MPAHISLAMYCLLIQLEIELAFDDSLQISTLWVCEDYFQRIVKESRTDYLASLSFHENSTATPFDLQALASFSPNRKRKLRENMNEQRLCHHCGKLVNPGEAVLCGRPVRLAKGQAPLGPVVLRLLGQVGREGWSHCPRLFCRFCLKYNYEEPEPLVAGRYACPVCRGKCFCPRCQRRDTLLRLINIAQQLGSISSFFIHSELSRLAYLFAANGFPAIPRLSSGPKKKTRRRVPGKPPLQLQLSVPIDLQTENETWTQSILLDRTLDSIRRLRVK